VENFVDHFLGDHGRELVMGECIATIDRIYRLYRNDGGIPRKNGWE
jgi:hypothetical protein